MGKAVGLMSGTSHDGIDAALVEIGLRGGRLGLRPLAFCTCPYPEAVRARLLRASSGATVTAGALSQLNSTLGTLFAEAAIAICKRAAVPLRDIDVIGSHGHTVYHGPRDEGCRSTLQIGEPAVIAWRTGVTTVADFRPADLASGGEGAPLVPFVHYLLFHRPGRFLAVHNIGGIANLTYIRGDRGLEGVIGFDSGPGNMVIDGVVSGLTAGRLLYDRGGRLARRGEVHAGLVTELMRHPYFRRPPPKSAGREEFGDAFVKKLLARAAALGLDRESTVATATAYTARSMADAYRRHVVSRGPVHEVLLCGGGRLNPVLRDMFARALGPTVRVGAVEEFGYDSRALEAIAFAVLAYTTLRGLPSNVPAATGASARMVLGKVVPGRNYGGTRVLGATAREGRPPARTHRGAKTIPPSKQMGR